ncbi:MAG TPA: PAS-domain containing protein [Stellaceae bacterium]|nr:PAS-domain containing protein [Stellaceae bacterium]
MVWLAGLLGLGVAGLAWVVFRQWQRLTLAEVTLKRVPAALYRMPYDGGGADFHGGPIADFQGLTPRAFAELLNRVRPADQGALADAQRRLRESGAGFRMSVTLAATGELLEVVGERSGEADLLWFLEAPERQAAQARHARMRAGFDALPLPIWRRRASDLALIDGNRAFANAVDATLAQALAEQRELTESARVLAARARASGLPQSESHHIVINGSRRFLELTEIPGDGGELIGFARDFTDLEALEARLSRHLSAYADVLETIGIAIAIYGPDTRLTFFNTAFATLWGLEEDWLRDEPTLDQVLERLAEMRRLPEYADFRAFKRQSLAMFTALIEPQEEMLHLPDERTLRHIVSPHPLGGLIFIDEEVTGRLQLESSYNTLIAVQRETLDNLYEGIAVFGSDGRLKLFNPAYQQIWRLSGDDLRGEPHMSEIIEKTRLFFEKDDSAWPELKQRVMARLGAPVARTTVLRRSDGSTLRAATVPLPDGNILLSYLDVTDGARAERALRERNGV